MPPASGFTLHHCTPESEHPRRAPLSGVERALQRSMLKVIPAGGIVTTRSVEMAVTQATIKSINPATGEVIQRYDEFTPAQVEDALSRARQTFSGWRSRGFDDRAQLMHRAANYLRDNID